MHSSEARTLHLGGHTRVILAS